MVSVNQIGHLTAIRYLKKRATNKVEPLLWLYKQTVNQLKLTQTFYRRLPTFSCR